MISRKSKNSIRSVGASFTQFLDRHIRGRILPQGVILFLVLLLVLVAVRTYFLPGVAATKEWSSVAIQAVSDRDHVLGNRNAPIQVIVFTDLACPYCKAFHEHALPALQSRFGDEVSIIYRHFPLDSIHPNARKEAEASECAFIVGGDKAFWDFITEIFAETAGENTFSLSRLPFVARKVGLDAAAYTSCMDRGLGVDQVAQNVLDGSVADIYKTPSVVVENGDGERILIGSGASYSAVATAISLFLKAGAVTR